LTYSNPVRWRNRRGLLNDFRQHMQARANVVLHTGELAYEARSFEVTGDEANDKQPQTSHELWQTEHSAPFGAAVPGELAVWGSAFDAGLQPAGRVPFWGRRTGT
jgi:hypothetical protein